MSSEPDASTVLGDFEIRREIGRGGMGTVYEAWQKSLHRVIALKVLSRQISGTPRAVLRFQREAQAAAKLHHTHIVPIFAQGEVDGNYFYAMELVHGRSISSVIAELRESQLESSTTVDLRETVALPRPDGSAAARVVSNADGVATNSPGGSGAVQASRLARLHFNFNEIARQIADVADALDYAHGQGVIHRDIKPHNLLLGDDGRIRVSDFGLARLAEQPGVTITGELLGSPLYMSSEQIRGNPDEVDARADIYSLGATLFEWLTLKPPYPGETREQVISMILTSEPKPVRSFNPAVPLDLETICMKAIEPDREKRYRTAGEMRDDLRRFIEKRPIIARRARIRERLAKFVSRHPNAAIAAFALVMALLLGWQIFQKQKKVEKVTAKADEAVKLAEETAVENERLLDLVAVLQGGPAKMAEAVVGGIAQADPAAMIASQMQPGNSQTEAVGKPFGIARRAAIDYFVAMTPTDWPPPQQNGEDESLANLRNAVSKMSAGEEPSALVVLSKYLESHSKDFLAWQVRAILNAKIGHYDDMEKDTQTMTTLGEYPARAKTWHGLAQLLQMRLNDCLGEFSSAIEMDGKMPWPRVLRGLALIQLSKGSDALTEFNTVLDSSPKMITALLGRATARKSMNYIEAAIPDATAVLQLEANNADALAIRSECYLAAGELTPARDDIDRAMKIAGHTPGLLLQKAAILYAERSQEGGRAKADGKSPSRQLAPTGTDVDERKSNGPFLDWWNRHSPPRGSGGAGGGMSLRIHFLP